MNIEMEMAFAAITVADVQAETREKNGQKFFVPAKLKKSVTINLPYGLTMSIGDIVKGDKK